MLIASIPGSCSFTLPAARAPIILPKAAVRDIEDYDEKLQAIAETYLDYDVRALTGTTCWFSILFERVLAAAKAAGAAPSTVADVWPNLRVLFGGGVLAEPYRPIIAERLGRPRADHRHYNATEGGIFAATDRRGDDADADDPRPRRVLRVRAARTSTAGRTRAALPLWEVEPGVEYAIVVTTCSGLFAY